MLFVLVNLLLLTCYSEPCGILRDDRLYRGVIRILSQAQGMKEF
jgi:hypothetical protein